MSQPKIKHQLVPIIVTSQGQEIVIDAETDKLYNTVTGINAVMTSTTNRFSGLQLEINTVEIFPEKFEVLRVLFREQVPFGYEYHELEEKGGGTKIKGKYKDVYSGAVYPYTVVLSFRLENL